MIKTIHFLYYYYYQKEGEKKTLPLSKKPNTAIYIPLSWSNIGPCSILSIVSRK